MLPLLVLDALKIVNSLLVCFYGEFSLIFEFYLLYPDTCPPVLSEDCLYLNVYTPRLVNLTQPQPVMVFLHGGHFDQGSAGKIVAFSLNFHSYL